MIKYYGNKLNRKDGYEQPQKQSLKHSKEKMCTHFTPLRNRQPTLRYENSYSASVVILIQQIVLNIASYNGINYNYLVFIIG
jgi:hypothetical protein